MGKNRYHTDVERAQKVALHKTGLSQRQISEQLGVSKSSVQRAIEKFNMEGIYNNRKKSGRPRKTTPRDDNTMKRIVAQSSTSSCKSVRANLLRKGTNVSISTISRRLSTEFGLKSYKPVKKPRLTPTMKKKRLEFARNKANFLIGGPILLQMMVYTYIYMYYCIYIYMYIYISIDLTDVLLCPPLIDWPLCYYETK